MKDEELMKEISDPLVLEVDILSKVIDLFYEYAMIPVHLVGGLLLKTSTEINA
jgi:hypothetical protein